MIADEMEKRFYETVLIASKLKNVQLFINDQYLSLIIKVKDSKNKITKKTPKHYQRLANNSGKNEGDPIMY